MSRLGHPNYRAIDESSPGGVLESPGRRKTHARLHAK